MGKYFNKTAQEADSSKVDSPSVKASKARRAAKAKKGSDPKFQRYVAYQKAQAAAKPKAKDTNDKK